MIAGGDLGRELVRIVDERRDAVDFELTFWRRNVADYPLVHADQDLINAAICARRRRPADRRLDPRLSASPPFTGLRVIDERALRCAYADGVEPYVVHHWLAKPWLEPTHHGVYSRLLRRLLVGEELAIRVPERLIPLRFRAGLCAYAERTRINVRERFRYHCASRCRARQERQPLKAAFYCVADSSATSWARSGSSTRCAWSATASRSSCSTAASTTSSGAAGAGGRAGGGTGRSAAVAAQDRDRRSRGPPRSRSWSTPTWSSPGRSTS